MEREQIDEYTGEIPVEREIDAENEQRERAYQDELRRS